jgi:hypothetical protein
VLVDLLQPGHRFGVLAAESLEPPAATAAQPGTGRRLKKLPYGSSGEGGIDEFSLLRDSSRSSRDAPDIRGRADHSLRWSTVNLSGPAPAHRSVAKA